MTSSARNDRTEPGSGPLGSGIPQPPNPVELRRDPPATPECARARGWMRDFADGDLTTRERELVEQHVHACRACAVALARAEHEVLRLRRACAIAPDSPAALESLPPPDFARRTVARLLAGDRSAPESGVDAAPARGVADGVRLRLHRRSRAAARNRQSPLAWILVLGGSAAAATLGSMLFWDSYGSPKSPTRLSVQSSVLSYRVERNGLLRPLEAGEGLTVGGTVVNDGGSLTGGLHDQSDGRQPALKVTLRNGQMTLGDGGVRLDRGDLEVVSQRPGGVELPDGTEVDLGVGTYQIDVQRAEGFDQLVQDEADRWSVSVEVVDGEDARVVRGLETVNIGSGNIGRYSGVGPISVGPGVAMAAGAGGAGREPVTSTPPLPDLHGSVIELNSNAGVGQATVQLGYLTQDRYIQRALVTDPTGRFELPAYSDIKGESVVLQVLPPPERSDLGVTMPDAYRITRTGSVYSFSQRFVLGPAPLLQGWVVDAEGRRLLGVRAAPCVYDELIGALLPWTEAGTTTDADGRFALPRLPIYLPAHMSLGVLTLHPDYEAAFTPVPLPGSLIGQALGEVVVRLTRVREIELRGLPSRRDFEVFEAMAGPYVGNASVRVHSGESSSLGGAELHVGRGALWLLTGPASHRQVQSLAPVAGSPDVYEPTGQAHDIEEEFGQLSSVPATPFLVTRSFRHQDFRPPRESSIELPLIPEMTFLVEAQVFAVRRGPGQTARPRFLGVLAQGRENRVDIEPGEVELVAIGNDSIGFIDLANWNHLPTRLPPMIMRGNGSLQLAPRLHAQGPVRLLFEPLRALPLGQGPRFERYVGGQTAWVLHGLPAGLYHVTYPSQAPQLVEIRSLAVTMLQ